MKTILIGILTMLGCYGYGQDVRNVKWGMTKSQVQAAEKSKGYTTKDGNVMYDIELSGSKFFIFYSFIDNKLVRASFVYNEKHYNKNAFVEKYHSLKEILQKKYGEPLKDEVEWSDDLYKNDPGQIGLAVSIGHAKLFAKFATSKTELGIMCTGDNFDISLVILYNSKEHRNLIMEKESREEADDF